VWIGVCNFAARATRNFASYGIQLAGYTLAIVGIPAALNPAGAYPLVLARFTEIALGVGCAALVSRLYSQASSLQSYSLALANWSAARSALPAPQSNRGQIVKSLTPNVSGLPLISVRWKQCAHRRSLRAQKRDS